MWRRTTVIVQISHGKSWWVWFGKMTIRQKILEFLKQVPPQSRTWCWLKLYYLKECKLNFSLCVWCCPDKQRGKTDGSELCLYGISAIPMYQHTWFTFYLCISFYLCIWKALNFLTVITTQCLTKKTKLYLIMSFLYEYYNRILLLRFEYMWGTLFYPVYELL